MRANHIQSLILLAGAGWVAASGRTELVTWVPVLILISVIVTATLNAAFGSVKTSSLSSGIISALSIAILLRATHIWVPIAALGLALASKYILTWDRQHVFNPSALGVALAAALFPAWVVPGQWQFSIWMGVLVIFLGLSVTLKARVWAMAWVFLSVHALVKGLFLISLGNPWNIVQHHLSQGALLVFAFFMVTDPKTVPQTLLGKTCWALWISLLALFFERQFFLPVAPLYALCFCQCLVWGWRMALSTRAMPQPERA